MARFGVVQGRLSPQVDDFIQNFPLDWQAEFKLATQLGVSHIEWIDGAPNERSSHLMKVRTDELAVPVSAICLDSFVRRQHLTKYDLIGDELTLIYAFDEAERLGIKKIVVPLLEKASLASCKELDQDLFDRYLLWLSSYASFAQDRGIRLSIETDLDAADVVRMLEIVDSANVTFDMGNLTRLGFDLNYHIDLYGDRIDNVHIKDCKVGGTTVELGSGDTDLSVIRRLVKLPNVEFLTFQTARSPGDAIDTFRYNVRTIEKILHDQ
jgi:L-ribulose-5-phosphate 3-epimerase